MIGGAEDFWRRPTANFNLNTFESTLYHPRSTPHPPHVGTGSSFRGSPLRGIYRGHMEPGW